MGRIKINKTISARGAKTFPFISGGNLGNRTILLRMSQRELIDLCVVNNIENMAAEESVAGTLHTQRKFIPDHAKGLAKYGLLGLVRITIEEMRREGQKISADILNLKNELEGGDSNYQAFQPMVANLMNCEFGGGDLEINQMQILNQNGKVENLFEIYEVTLYPQHLISLLDGQHRQEGFKMIDEWLVKITSTGEYPKKGLYVPEEKGLSITPELIEFWAQVYRHGTYSATLSIEIHLGLDIQAQRQLFNDLNAKGKKVEISLQQSFDRSDAVNKLIEDTLMGKEIPWNIIQADQENWSEDDGSLVRKYLNPITALAMFGKASTKGVTPMKAKRSLLQAKSFWSMMSKIPHFGENKAKAKTIAAQPVVLKAIAKLFYDTGWGRSNVRNEKDWETLVNELRNIDFSHNNELWGSLMMDSNSRNEKFPGIENYVFVPKGTNLDAGTIDKDFGWVRYGMKHNDIFPRIGDLIRYRLKLNPRSTVTSAIKKEQDNS